MEGALPGSRGTHVSSKENRQRRALAAVTQLTDETPARTGPRPGALREPPHPLPPHPRKSDLELPGMGGQADPCGQAGPLRGAAGPLPRAGPQHAGRGVQASAPLLLLLVLGRGLSLCLPSGQGHLLF